MSARRTHRTASCDACGKRVAAKTPFYAYRPMGVTWGPWIIERLCAACVDGYIEIAAFNLRRTYRVQQMSLPGYRTILS